MARTRTDVREVKAPPTANELDAFLAAYKEKNPAKYAAKEAAGEFEKLKKAVK
jgi:hypothetical protein